MTRVKQAPRDTTRLTGKRLPDTLAPSPILHTQNEQWTTSPDLAEDNLPYTPGTIDNITLYLLANPNRMSSHLFRADVLFDNWGVLSTPEQKKERFLTDTTGLGAAASVEPTTTTTGGGSVEPVPAKLVPDFELSRTVVRRLIPRNPNLDKPLDQTCHFYVHGRSSNGAGHSVLGDEGSVERLLVVYTPHIETKKDLPWYHPLLQSWALLYDYHKVPTAASSVAGVEEATGKGQLSLHFLLYPGEEISNRLERTLHALINTQLRLARGSISSSPSAMLPEGGTYKPSKDNVIPQHLVQNTYLRLKLKYASGLHKEWVEDTDPSKHVFEDLAIAAFLVELWRSMYGVVPCEERGRGGSGKEADGQGDFDLKFPGFVDVACGNGVLVYLLLMEGYQGWGFDARQRKTWKIFPEWVQERLREEIYIPKSFVDVLGNNEIGSDIGVKTHTGMFPKDTFIISNHADELTVWTPLMAALANPRSPLPFLAIPCCSHSLSGARFRYPPPKENGNKPDKNNKANDFSPDQTDPEVEQNPQPASGDLKALRSTKIDAQTTEAGMNRSMYGSLTAKTMSVAKDIGYGVEKTMLRMPSTRNMGVLGGRRRIALARNTSTSMDNSEAPAAHFSTAKIGTEGLNVDSGNVVVEQVGEIVRRECAREGGVEAAGKIWIKRVKGLHQGKGSSQRH